MINFNIVKKLPGEPELRAYMYQLLDKPSLPEAVRIYLERDYPEYYGKRQNKIDISYSSTFEDILSETDIPNKIDISDSSTKIFVDSLSETDMRNILNVRFEDLIILHEYLDENNLWEDPCPIYMGSFLPEIIFFFNTVENPFIDYTQAPQLFTGIKQVSFEKGGMIVFEKFCGWDGDILFNKKGEELLNYGEIELGLNGGVFQKFPWNGYDIYYLKARKLVRTYGGDDYWASDHDYRRRSFVFLENRDVIKEMYPIKFPDVISNGLNSITNARIKTLLSSNDSNYRYLVKYYKNDEELAACAVKSNKLAFTLLSKKLRNNKQFVLKLLAENNHIYLLLSQKLKKDSDVLLRIDRYYYFMFPALAPVSRRKLMLKAVKHEGVLLKYASRQLKNDRAIVLAAITQNWEAFQFASAGLKRDTDITLFAVRKNGLALAFASDVLKNNKKVVFKAVSQNWEALKYASEKMKENFNLVLIAINQNGLALAFASELLKNDKKIVFEAVSQNWEALKYVSAKMKGDFDLLLFAVRQHGLALRYASEELKGDRRIALEAVKKSYEALEFVSEKLKMDKEFVIEALKIHPKTYFYLPWIIKSDSEFINSLENLGIYPDTSDELPF